VQEVEEKRKFICDFIEGGAFESDLVPRLLHVWRNASNEQIDRVHNALSEVFSLLPEVESALDEIRKDAGL
jgi:hypothetical protein